jgi:hypothetical protein
MYTYVYAGIIHVAFVVIMVYIDIFMCVNVYIQMCIYAYICECIYRQICMILDEYSCEYISIDVYHIFYN